MSWKQENIDSLSDSYIRNQVSKYSGQLSADVTDEQITARRIRILEHRKRKKEIADTGEDLKLTYRLRARKAYKTRSSQVALAIEALDRRKLEAEQQQIEQLEHKLEEYYAEL